MKAGEISNHPFSVPLLPIKRGAPLLLIYFFPTRRMPPAKIIVASGFHEFQVIGVAHRRAIDPKIFEEDLVLRFLIVEREVIIGIRASLSARGERLARRDSTPTLPTCGE